MLNTNYAPEIASAHKFVMEHSADTDLYNFLHEMRSPFLTHSERWSKIYDWMQEHYPEVTGTIITGLAYFLEG